MSLSTQRLDLEDHGVISIGRPCGIFSINSMSSREGDFAEVLTVQQ